MVHRAWYTGHGTPVYNFGIAEPSNIPDTIKDYHIISIARNIDYWSKPEYKAVIKRKKLNYG